MTRHKIIGALALLSVLLLVSFESVAFAGGVHGRVLGMNEAGEFTGMVASAKIEFIDQAGRTVATTTSGPSGYYRASLPPGAYTYKAQADGYKDQDAGRGLRLKRADDNAIYNISLIKGVTSPDRPPVNVPTFSVGVLRGRVIEQTIEGNIGVGHASIMLRKEGAKELLRVVTERGDQQGDQAGQYEVILEAGTYMASVSAAGFKQLVDPEPIEIVADGEATRDFVLGHYQPPPDLLAKQGIRGTVVVMKNGGTVPPSFPVRVDVLALLDREVLYTTGPDDSSGSFSQTTAPGKYRVMAYAPDNGYYKTISPPVFVFPGRFSNVKLTLRPEQPDVLPPTEFTINVHVTDQETRKPLQGVVVRLRRSGQAISEAVRGTTDVNGVAAFPADKAGSFSTIAGMSGYRTSGAQFEAGPGETNRVQIALTRTSAPPPRFDVVVAVRESENDRPVSDATVVLFREGQTPREGTRRTTSGNGQATFRVESSGNYGVFAGASGYRPEQVKLRVGPNEPNRVNVVLRDGDAPPTEHVAVTGKVVYEPPRGTTGYGLISGAALEWRRMAPLPGLPRRVTSNDVGQYRVNLREGTYQVKIKPPSPDFLPATVTVKVTRGMKPWDFSLKRVQEGTPPPSAMVEVEGFVLARDRDKRLRAVADSALEWRRTSGGPPVSQTARSSRMGRYGVKLPAGEYTVTIKPPATYEQLTAKVRVHIGMRSQNFTLTATSGVVPPPPMQLVGVTGTVIGIKPPSRMRIPIPNAEVLWLRTGRTTKTTTDQTGKFKTRLAAGSYRVIAKAAGYEELDRPISVRPNMSPVMLSLRATSTGPIEPSKVAVDLRVIERRLLPNRRSVSIPLSDARVLVQQRTKTFASGTTGRDGTYRALLPPGRYDVKVTRQGYASAAMSLSVSSTAIKRDVVLRREQPKPPPSVKKALTVRVVYSLTMRPGTRPILRPLPQTSVTIMKGNSRVATGKTDNSGNYRVTLDPGNYTIKVSGQGILPAGASVTIGTSDTTRQVIVKRAASTGPTFKFPDRRRPTFKKKDSN